MQIISFEWVVGAAAVVLALMFWVVHILLDVQRAMRQSLASFEDKLIQLEDETRRLHHDATALKSTMQTKVESHTLNQRLEGLATLLGLTKLKR
ncbi:hypothetical protein HY994_05020 [Candidatus Micrarchaeota archaeon]|nr:hypothetical protein [Candidatus Micrarchaeota archaeon]